MKLLTKTGIDDVAVIYIAETAGGNLIEFVESLQKSKSRSEKWILTISTLYGCPVNCSICDAGPYYLGRISKEGIFWQINYMITKRFPDSIIPVKQLKVHFTRMGEPAFNMNVLDVIDEFDMYFKAPGFFPSISTIAPKGTDKFFDEMMELKNRKFRNGNFQLQYSIHTTDEAGRDILIPVKKWSFEMMGMYGEKFYQKGDRKITLNFAPAKGFIIEPGKIFKYFDPEIFLIKLSPLNNTKKSVSNKLTSLMSSFDDVEILKLSDQFRNIGYEVIMGVNEYEENLIGSTCGQNILSQFNQSGI